MSETQPYLECDECGARSYALGHLAEIHECGRQGVWRLIQPVAATSVVCAACGAPFAEGWTPEEVEAEYAETFPVEHAAGVPMELVCARCYDEGTREDDRAA